LAGQDKRNPLKSKMKLPQFCLVVILGSILNFGITSGLPHEDCIDTLTREEYIEMDYVCDECYNEWQSLDIYYNCPNKCFKNEHFSVCLDTMPSIPKDVKEEIRIKVGLK
jgi:hypothetical protein